MDNALPRNNNRGGGGGVAGGKRRSHTFPAIVNDDNAPVGASAAAAAAAATSMPEAKRRATDATKPKVNRSAAAAASRGGGLYDPEVDPMGFLQNLPPLPRQALALRSLSKDEVAELETILEFRAAAAKDQWKDDWGGNLALVDKEILHPSLKSTGTTKLKSFRQSLIVWATNSPPLIRLVRNLLYYVCNMPKIPPTVKRLLGTLAPDADMEDIVERIRRSSYDPKALGEDGWTTVKSTTKVGANGGPFWIGDWVFHDGFDAVVIAYVHDSEYGDLWKAMHVHDLATFDLEVEELLDARRKWTKRNAAPPPASAPAPVPPPVNAATAATATTTTSRTQKSGRHNGSLDFTVKGLEHGIVMAASYSKGARPNVHWPARVIHASESGHGGWDSGTSTSNGTNGSSGGGGGGTVRRTITKQKVELVFLAPYWRTDDGVGRANNLLSTSAESTFNAIPLFQVETVDAVDEMLKEYPYTSSDGIDLAQLTLSFRFTGLPKAALPRYLNAHRIAAALREYSKEHLKGASIATDRAAAGLFETHPMMVQTPNFPSVILHLPFDFILSKLPRTLDDRPLGTWQSGNRALEPILNLSTMVQAMEPPYSWGASEADKGSVAASQERMEETESVWIKAGEAGESDTELTKSIHDFMEEFPVLNDVFNRHCSSPPIVGAISNMTMFLAQIGGYKEANVKDMDSSSRRIKLKALTTAWAVWKRLGEESLTTVLHSKDKAAIIEWRRLAEKIYQGFLQVFGDGETVGSGLSVVISDTRCNGHRTSNGCFERPVRLPAALKGAKLAGVGSDKASRLITSVPDSYIDLVESRLLHLAHTAQYLKRMKSRCAAATSDNEVLVLTDNSSGEGGEDTSKYRTRRVSERSLKILMLNPCHLENQWAREERGSLRLRELQQPSQQLTWLFKDSASTLFAWRDLLVTMPDGLFMP
jgi:hypothetical protein